MGAFCPSTRPWPPLDILRSLSVRALPHLSTACCPPQHTQHPRREQLHRSSEQRVVFSHAVRIAAERACSLCADAIAHHERAQHDPAEEPTVRWRLCRSPASAAGRASKTSQHTLTQNCARLAWQVTRRRIRAYLRAARRRRSACCRHCRRRCRCASCELSQSNRSSQLRRRQAEAAAQQDTAEPPAEPQRSRSRAAAEPRTCLVFRSL